MADPLAAASGVELAPLRELARAVDPGRSVVVTDGELRRLYGEMFPPCPIVEVPRGEAAKELGELARLYGAFDRLGLDRGSTVVAIGGGSVSDLAGFAAATWMRGVDFCAAPTTLLAMVDAALGGKNGVDFGGRKNLVGSFHPPRLVLCDVSLLASLPVEQVASGMAEAIKHAVIEGGSHFDFIEGECSRPAGLDGDRLGRLVRLSQAVKLGIVARDPRESGERRKLNLGHSIGHAVESVSGLPHGHALSVGLASAFRLAAGRGYAGAAAALGRLTRLLEGWGLPSSIEAAHRAARCLPGNVAGAGDAAAFRDSVAAALVADKKRSRGEILFAMPVAIGDVRVEPIALGDLERFVREVP